MKVYLVAEVRYTKCESSVSVANVNIEGIFSSCDKAENFVRTCGQHNPDIVYVVKEYGVDERPCR